MKAPTKLPRNPNSGVRRKVMVVAPFWRQPRHIGRIRVAEFVRWLTAAGVETTVVCSGPRDEVLTADEGVEISIRDPLRLDWSALQSEAAPEAAAAARPRAATPLKDLASGLLQAVLNPDMEAAWAWRAARHPLVRRHAADSSAILSSSPPESAHVAAAKIAQFSGAELFVDLRDGWLDFPLRTNLANSRFRRWRERPLERRVLRQAKEVFVTSDVWREKLVERYPEVASRTCVLANGYPDDSPTVLFRSSSANELRLIYGGRFGGSRPERRPAALLKPLTAALGEHRDLGGVIECIGDYDADDRAALLAAADELRRYSWRLEMHPPAPRSEFVARLAAADGLLLLAASPATIPRKLFEYLPTRRPILAVAPAGGAMARLVADVPQLCPVAADGEVAAHRDAFDRFFRLCLGSGADAAVPRRFGESERRRRFFATLGMDESENSSRERQVA